MPYDGEVKRAQVCRYHADSYWSRSLTLLLAEATGRCSLIWELDPFRLIGAGYAVLRLSYVTASLGGPLGRLPD